MSTVKTSIADLMTQCVIERKSFSEVDGKSFGLRLSNRALSLLLARPPQQIDWKRNMVFIVFGALYLGCFQWWIQVGGQKNAGGGKASSSGIRLSCPSDASLSKSGHNV